MISYIILYKLLIKNLLEDLKTQKSMRSLILIIISYIILYKFLIKNLLED